MGGTFDPVHLGHLRAAEEVSELMRLERVIFIPAAKPPHKGEEGIVDFNHRWRMLELAVAGNPRFELSDLEYNRPGKSYSVETLSLLTDKISEKVYFIVGLDAFLELPTWKSYRELFSLCHFVVVARPGYSTETLHTMLRARVSEGYVFDPKERGFIHPQHYTVYYREITLLDISSSRIRKSLAKGQSVRYLLPKEVEAYIRRQGIYQHRQDSRGQ